jgi:hypothetical protein
MTRSDASRHRHLPRATVARGLAVPELAGAVGVSSVVAMIVLAHGGDGDVGP